MGAAIRRLRAVKSRPSGRGRFITHLTSLIKKTASSAGVVVDQLGVVEVSRFPVVWRRVYLVTE
jgi:hypothetical protein